MARARSGGQVKASKAGKAADASSFGTRRNDAFSCHPGATGLSHQHWRQAEGYDL